jgi:predicted nucleotidyltransferase
VKVDNQRIIARLEGNDFAQFCQNNNIILAILHGSRATDSARDDSDFDLALLLNYDFKMDALEAGALKRSLLHKLIQFLSSSRVDLTILNTASKYFKYEVTQKGLLLFEAEEEAYARFVSFVIRSLSDDRLFREAEKKYISMQV